MKPTRSNYISKKFPIPLTDLLYRIHRIVDTTKFSYTFTLVHIYKNVLKKKLIMKYQVELWMGNCVWYACVCVHTFDVIGGNRKVRKKEKKGEIVIIIIVSQAIYLCIYWFNIMPIIMFVKHDDSRVGKEFSFSTRKFN